jgi:hypothetical protein
MCFSPEASFTGGIVISAIGIAAIRKISHPRQLLFAGIPLFFGIQQIAEGGVWVSLPDPALAGLQRAGTFVFLLMARVIWPMLIPLSLLLMEKDATRRSALSVLLAMGLSVSVYYSYCLLFLTVTPHMSGHHIQYVSDYPESLAVPVFIIYFVAAITPFFISTVQKIRVLGAFMFLSCLATAIFFVQYLTSVWCFFAAMISVVIIWILRSDTRSIAEAAAERSALSTEGGSV